MGRCTSSIYSRRRRRVVHRSMTPKTFSGARASRNSTPAVCKRTASEATQVRKTSPACDEVKQPTARVPAANDGQSSSSSTAVHRAAQWVVLSAGQWSPVEKPNANATARKQYTRLRWISSRTVCSTTMTRNDD
jgi:hypothetical protein